MTDLQDFPLAFLQFNTVRYAAFGVIPYQEKNGDSMWDIAKRFYTTVEEICELNELEEDRVVPGMPLLLVKKVEG